MPRKKTSKKKGNGRCAEGKNITELETGEMLLMHGEKVSEGEELQEMMKDPIRENGGWRLQNRRLLLTYKTHLNKNEFREFIMKKVRRLVELAKDEKEKNYIQENNEIIIGWEEGKKKNELSPYLHTHAYVDFGANF